MKDVGNVLVRYWDSYEKKFITGSRKEFEEMFDVLDVNAEDIKIELPEANTAKANGEIKDEAFYNDDEITEKDKIKDEPTKFEILKKIKDGTIKPHPTIGGTYYSWIQIVICKAIKQGCGDNEILKLIKEVHKDKIGKVDSEYTWPESYKKQINYTRGGRQLNKANPGDTKILEGISKHALRLNLYYAILNKLDIVANVKFSGEKFIFEQEEDFFELQELQPIKELSSYFISDLYAVTTFKKISFKIGIKNIFNYKDSNRFSSDILNNYDPGRRVFVEFDLGFKGNIND